MTNQEPGVPCMFYPRNESFTCECTCECTGEEKREVVEAEALAGHNSSSGCAGCGKARCPVCGYHLCTDCIDFDDEEWSEPNV